MKANEKQKLLDKIEELKKQVEQLDKKKDRFIPEKGEQYFSIAIEGGVRFFKNDRDGTDNYLISTGNCFRTAEEAEEYKERLIFNQSVIDRIAELNGDWEYKEGEEYWQIMFHYKYKKLEVDNWRFFRFTSKEKIFKSWKIGKTILKEFDNDKLINWFI